MKTVVINAAPKRRGCNAKLMKSALKGAESVGADVKYVDLYKLDLQGCMTCLICKKEGNEGKCYWKDDLSPVLEKIWQADRLITGAPIYYSEPAGGFRSFFERLTFPAMSYNDYSSVFKGQVDVDVFLTMNAPMQYYKQAYERKMQEY